MNIRKTFTRKGYGRIYVRDIMHVDTLHTLIRKLDPYEYDYMPKDLVTAFDQYPKVVYTGKFDELNLDTLTVLAWNAGMHIWCFDAGLQEYVPDARVPSIDLSCVVKTR